jgi:hypothetical protein
MTLTGACPGSVLPQIATGVKSGPMVVLGMMLGGILYSRYGKGLKNPKHIPQVQDNNSIYEQLGFTKISAISFYEGLCAALLGLSSLLAPGDREVILPPIVGGLLIGGSQLTSVMLTGNTLGISTAYEQIGDLFWWMVRSLTAQQTTAIPNLKSTAFAAGTFLGSWALSRAVDLPTDETIEVSTARALIGGVVILFGSRIAGGCTSGHGLSGMSLLSVSSIITVAAMFAGGMGLAALLN